MRNWNRLTALALSLVLLLSWVPAGSLPVHAAASDYISATYAANLSVKTT